MGMWARHTGARRAAPTPPPAPERVAPRPEPVRMPAPEPEPPKLAAAPPPPEPEPEPELEPEPEPEPAVSYLPVDETPREWNLWELERVSRDNAGDDVARNEELAYLLMYLREFAGPDGALPADFDGLVRDAFGDLLRTVAL